VKLDKTKNGWKAGVSGNPAGRKKGSGKVAAIRAGIEARLPDILEAMMQKALQGDVQAAKLLLERTVAPLKPAEQAQVLSLPKGTLTKQGQAVLVAVGAGEIAPTQGATLINAISSLARVTEIDELAARIAALEENTK
jgi:hypothetical protein